MRGNPRDGFLFDSARIPVIVRPHTAEAMPLAGALAFTVAGPSGEPLLDAFVDPLAIESARARWRRQA